MIINGDAVKWARNYAARIKCGEDLPLFHAMMGDPPYHLTTITKRFGKEGSAPAQFGTDGVYARAGAGFMGQTWDGGDVAFRPETWRAFKRILHDGAFGMMYGGSRTVHRMAVAIEDAGFIIHPLMGWAYGTGFPKATSIHKQLAKQVTAEEEFLVKEWEGHRYGMQALKPAFEPIIVFQKPYDPKIKTIFQIASSGAGALNIDGGRIEKGRWPANIVITHNPDCQIVGYKDDQYAINRFTDGAKPFGEGAGYEFETEEMKGKTPVWECVEGCPALALDKQTGKLKSGTGAVKKATGKGNKGEIYSAESRPEGTPNIEYGDEGGASRYFHQSGWQIENSDPFLYQKKSSKSEREAGLKGILPCLKCGELHSEYHRDAETNKIVKCYRCGHPTVKPIELNKHLATLLLPPDHYKPRRIFIPFAGVASEMIGAKLAGWDQVVGVELTEKYIPTNKARWEYWINPAQPKLI